MNKNLLALAVAGALSSPLIAMADEPASPLSFNVGVTSDYLFRGVSQTHGKPAVQAGVDYAFENGSYVGAWASSISWVKNWTGDGSLEIDVYGGYKGAITDGLGFDVGYITYNYPGKGPANAGLANPNTQEVYAALSYKWLTAKYSYATSSHFVGWYGGAALDEKTRGSDYLELNANYDLGDGWTLIGHVGHQKIKKNSSASYTDWKIGASKDVGFGVVSLTYSDTNAEACSDASLAYCWTKFDLSDPKNVAKGKAVLSFTKTF